MDRASPEQLRQHFFYWWELEERGKLLGAGPFDRGMPEERGVATLVAESLHEAEELAFNELLHKGGRRRNEVHHWQLNEGVAVALVERLESAPS